MVALLCALFLIPVVPEAGWDVRSNGEAFPLNGPVWSLFFEYIGNLLYALFLVPHIGSEGKICLSQFSGYFYLLPTQKPVPVVSSGLKFAGDWPL